MIKIFSASNLQDAYLIQGLLTEAGIETHLLNEFSQGGMGEIPFTHTYPEIWLVNEVDTDNAKNIITQYERQAYNIGNIVCRRCNEENPDTFETCWSCGTPLVRGSPQPGQ